MEVMSMAMQHVIYLFSFVNEYSDKRGKLKEQYRPKIRRKKDSKTWLVKFSFFLVSKCCCYRNC